MDHEYSPCVLYDHPYCDGGHDDHILDGHDGVEEQEDGRAVHGGYHDFHDDEEHFRDGDTEDVQAGTRDDKDARRGWALVEHESLVRASLSLLLLA